MIKTPELLETERIQSLKKYDILDTPPDGSFDRITKLAAILLDVPIAIVTMVDTDRIWFKSKYGVDVQQIGRDPGLCASAILSDEFYEVTDTKTDPRTLSNPLVASEFGLRFYAAVPLKVRDGYNLGTLCILDKTPRHLNETQKQILQYLADITIDQIELRLSARMANYHQNQLLGIAAHDLKSPLSTMIAWAELANENKENPEILEKMCHSIKVSANKMNSQINNLLESAREAASKIEIRSQVIDLSSVIESVIQINEVLANNKKIVLHLKLESKPTVLGDEDRLIEMADNLINNAIKYSPSGKNIFVSLGHDDDHAILHVTDEGQGFTEEDKKFLFKRFVKLSAKPTAGESSTGLGLSIVKSLAEAHKGEVTVHSEGKYMGATLTVKLPLLKQ